MDNEEAKAIIERVMGRAVRQFLTEHPEFQSLPPGILETIKTTYKLGFADGMIYEHQQAQA